MLCSEIFNKRSLFRYITVTEGKTAASKRLHFHVHFKCIFGPYFNNSFSNICTKHFFSLGSMWTLLHISPEPLQLVSHLSPSSLTPLLCLLPRWCSFKAFLNWVIKVLIAPKSSSESLLCDSPKQACWAQEHNSLNYPLKLQLCFIKSL